MYLSRASVNVKLCTQGISLKFNYYRVNFECNDNIFVRHCTVSQKLKMNSGLVN